MQHKQPALETGTALLRTQGLVLVSNTAKGRGVFASKPIPTGTVIDVCPVLVFSEDETTNHISQTCLDHYTYSWPPPHPSSSTSSSDRRAPGVATQALALGLGSLFNHSALHQNVGWTRNLDARCITYTALRDIVEGEELCISYGGGRLWFEDVEAGVQVGGGGGMDHEDEGGRGSGELELELAGLGRVGVDGEEEE